MKLPRLVLALAFIAFPAALIAATAAADDDDLFSSKPAKPAPPTTPAATTPPAPEVLPLPSANPLTLDQADAEAAQSRDALERAVKILQAANNVTYRDWVLRRYADVMIDLGDYAQAIGAAEAYNDKRAATDEVLARIARRHAAQKNTNGILQALNSANQLAGKQLWESAQISHALVNTRLAARLGDAEALKQHFSHLATAFKPAADRDVSKISLLLSLADAAPEYRRAASDSAAFYADLQTRATRLDDSVSSNGLRVGVAQSLFTIGMIDEALAGIALAGEPTLQLYRDAAAFVRAKAGADFEAAWKNFMETHSSANPFERFAMLALASRALSLDGRHEDALRLALEGEVARLQNKANVAKETNVSPLRTDLGERGLTLAVPTEWDELPKPVVERAVAAHAADAIAKILRARMTAAQSAEARYIVLTAGDRLVDALRVDEDFDSAVRIHRELANAESTAALELAGALIRAGRLDDAESAVLRGPLDEKRRADLWLAWLLLADAWRAKGDAVKARAALTAAGPASIAYHVSQGKVAAQPAAGELPLVQTDKDRVARFPAEPVQVAAAWLRLGDAVAARKLLGKYFDDPAAQRSFVFADAQRFADARDFAKAAEKIAALPTFDPTDVVWRLQAGMLADALARGGQWKLIAALALKTSGPAQAAPFLEQFAVIGARLKEAETARASASTSSPAKAGLAPFGAWVATLPPKDAPAKQAELAFSRGRLGVWDEAIAVANAPGLAPKVKAQLWLSLTRAARFNLDWKRAAENLANARTALAAVTGADRDAELLAGFCTEAISLRDMTEVAERFRESYDVASKVADLRSRFFDLRSIADLAILAADGNAFNTVGGAMIECAKQYRAAEPAVGEEPSRADLAMAYFLRDLCRFGHHQAAQQIANLGIAHAATKEAAVKQAQIAALAAEKDEALLSGLNKLQTHDERLKMLLGDDGDGLVDYLVRANRIDAAIKLLATARDFRLRPAYPIGDLRAMMDDPYAKARLQIYWHGAVQRLGETLARGGRFAAAASLGRLFTDKRESGTDVLAAAQIAAMEPLDFSVGQASFALFLAQKGQRDEAARLINALPPAALAGSSDHLKSYAAGTLALLGELPRGESIAQPIKDPARRLAAFSALATAAARSGDKASAAKFLRVAREARAALKKADTYTLAPLMIALVSSGDAKAAWSEAVVAGQPPPSAWGARIAIEDFASAGRWPDVLAFIQSAPAELKGDLWSVSFSSAAPDPVTPPMKPQ